MTTKALIQSKLWLASLLLVSGYAVAADIHITGAGIEQQVSCNNNNLFVTGADNTIQASGHCNRIEVVGADTNVSAQSVNQIKITGASSSVVYKSSLNKNGKASVNVTGADSYARKQ